MSNLVSKLNQIDLEVGRVTARLGSYQGGVRIDRAKEGLDGKKVRDVFAKAFPDADCYPLDGKYRATTLETIEEIIEEFHLLVLPYVKAYRDCEDFAMYGFARFRFPYELNQVAVNYSKVHGYCSFCMIDEQLEVQEEIIIWEPQSKRLIPARETESASPSVEMPEQIYIKGLGKWRRLDDAIKEGMYQTRFYQV